MRRPKWSHAPLTDHNSLAGVHRTEQAPPQQLPPAHLPHPPLKVLVGSKAPRHHQHISAGLVAILGARPAEHLVEGIQDWGKDGVENILPHLPGGDSDPAALFDFARGQALRERGGRGLGGWRFGSVCLAGRQLMAGVRGCFQCGVDGARPAEHLVEGIKPRCQHGVKNILPQLPGCNPDPVALLDLSWWQPLVKRGKRRGTPMCTSRADLLTCNRNPTSVDACDVNLGCTHVVVAQRQ